MAPDKLVTFLAVAETGSISDAAKKLFVSHSTVSRAVSALEEELGVRLIERGNRVTGLTPAGEILVRRAPELLKLTEEIESELKESHNM